MKDYEILNIKTSEYYGFDKQSNLLMEECAELIQAVNKYKRNPSSGTENIIEEIADVELMIEQIKHLLGINTKYVEGNKQHKVERQKKRMATENKAGEAVG